MKISKILKATFGLLCARCHKGKLLRFHPYNLKKLGDTNRVCSNCGLRFSREPGFFFGSAYVSYMLTVAIGAAVVVIGALLREFVSPSLGWYTILAALILVLVLLFPLVYVWARAMWLAFFVPYAPEKRGED
jgi:uncharacterized protein (DUF983 family)